LVSWPKDSVRPNPGAEGIHNYVLVRNFDTPIWQQIARPADGTNLSVIWNRTPLETLQAFGQHFAEIAANIPAFFFIQPLPFFLCIVGLCSIPLMPRKTRLLYGVCMVWSVIWLSTYLLVPDSSAFRRAVAFPGCFAIVLALAFVRLFQSRRGGLIALALGSALALARLPHELAFANLAEARMRMFTLCATAPAHRALLNSSLVQEHAKGQVFVLSNGLTMGRERSCFDDATRSSEWRRLIPNTTILDVQVEKGLDELAKVPRGALVVAYCNFESERLAHIAALCKGKVPNVAVVGEVPNSYDGGHWVLLVSEAGS